MPNKWIAWKVSRNTWCDVSEGDGIKNKRPVDYLVFDTKKTWLDTHTYTQTNSADSTDYCRLVSITVNHEGGRCVVIFISTHITVMRQHHTCMTHFFFFAPLLFRCKEYSTLEEQNKLKTSNLTIPFVQHDWIRTLQFNIFLKAKSETNCPLFRRCLQSERLD